MNDDFCDVCRYYGINRDEMEHLWKKMGNIFLVLHVVI